MNAGPILWAVCALIASTPNRVQANNECVVMAPNALRLGARETVVAMASGRAQKVVISLVGNRPGRSAFFETTLDVEAGSAGVGEVLVRPEDVPHMQLTKGDATVKLSVQCGAWSRDVLLPLSGASADHLFLQTDKPIYHPGSTVNIRFIALNGTLEPSSTPFKLEVRNPQNVVLEAKEFNPEQDIMLSHQFAVPKPTILGEWSLVMRYGHKFEQNTTTTFAVEKYVLPRFSVQIHTPGYILPGFADITVDVRAKFVNQLPVRGFVSFKFSVKNEVGDLTKIGTSNKPKQLVAGDCTYKLARTDLVSRLGEGQLDALFRTRARLVVEATVTEEATGIQETGRNEQAVFTTSPYLISTARSEKSFKPGTKFYVVAEVTYTNGEPAARVPTRLTSENGRVQTMSHRTDVNGVVTFLIISTSGDGEFKFTVETADQHFPEDQQAKAFVMLQAYKDGSTKYIAIERKDPRALVAAGSTYEASIFKPQNSQLTSAYYVVLSRGRVMEAAKIATVGGVLDPKVAFVVTPEMTPSFRLLVVAFVDNDLVTDAVYVNAVPTCTTDSHFTLTWKSPQAVLEPGSTETLLLKGTEGTRVGLLGVDQAVYLLRRKDLLTRKKVFQSMEAKDMGNGQDAGRKAVETLANAGVVLLTSQASYAAPVVERQRGKREIKLDIVKEYENETLRDCCSRGMQPDQLLRSCSEREEALLSYLDAGVALYTRECVAAFGKCCIHVEDNQAVGRSSAEEADVLGMSNFKDLEGEERRNFRETWIFNQLTLREHGEASLEVTVPDSITTWEVSAVGVAPSGGICVLDPLEIPVFKKLFVEVNLPYSVIKKEQIDIPATVYNYDHKDLKVRVAMLGTKDVCSGAKEGKRSSVRTLTVPAGQGRTVVFPVVPLAAGEREIRVAAYSDGSAIDSVKVMLRVEPPGFSRNESFNLILDPQNTQKRPARNAASPTHGYRESFAPGGKQFVVIKLPDRSPKEVIPGSERCEINIVGDEMGAALEASVKNPGDLLKRMPKNCGEQIMIYLAPTLYAYEYLKTASRISPEDERIALRYIRRGYQMNLNYRKSDGSFAVWSNYNSSLWLTAFVVRTLCKAQKYIPIDKYVITSGLGYILTQQKQDGSFHDIFNLIHGDLLGGVNGTVPLTAYTLLTLQECDREGVQVAGLTESFAKATGFIEGQLNPNTSPYVLSLAAYALSLGKSPAKNGTLRRLGGIFQRGNEGGLYVSAGSEPLSVEATSYALMALLNAGESRDDITAMVQWLNLQMNPSGSLRSSQDTVVALQALSKYALYARDADIDLTCEVTLSGDRNFNRTLRIKRDNAQQRNRIEIPDSNDKIFVNVKGTGRATMYFVTSYESPVGADLLCKFDLKINFTQQKVNVSKALEGKGSFKKIYSMEVCARSLEKKLKGMAILDVGLLTGFNPVLADLDKLVADKRVDSYELSQRSVVFYLSTIPSHASVCVEFGLQQEFAVGKLQSGSVKAYAYYDPDISCRKFYSPDSTSPLLKSNCSDDNEGHSDVCKCLEGIESQQDLLNKTRVVKARENCESFKLTEGSRYIIMGKDAKYKEKDRFGDEQYVYVIDSDSVVIPVEAAKKPSRTEGGGRNRPGTKPSEKRPSQKPEDQKCDFGKLIAWFINEFSDESKRCNT
ncbi:venom factor-like isoform X1 [Amblyomma americanum]